MTFRVGDRVEWTSQSGGRVATKCGSVVEVVPAGSSPKTRVPQPGAWGGARDHESYVVRGATLGDERRKRAYWPLVSHLRAEGEAQS